MLQEKVSMALKWNIALNCRRLWREINFTKTVIDIHTVALANHEILADKYYINGMDSDDELPLASSTAEADSTTK